MISQLIRRKLNAVGCHRSSRLIELAKDIASREKHVNLVVNNAGVGGGKNEFYKQPVTPDSVSQALFHADIKIWDDVLKINTSSMYYIAGENSSRLTHTQTLMGR